jgi:hypothetical protein
VISAKFCSSNSDICSGPSSRASAATWGARSAVIQPAPGSAGQRAAKRESLLAATEEELGKIRASVQAGRVKDAEKIRVKVGKVINKRKVGKHFITDIADGRLEFRRDQEKIDAEAELDGIYVIRTSAAEERLGAAETVGTYKELGNLERDFWSMKAEDIDLRPIYHYLEDY